MKTAPQILDQCTSEYSLQYVKQDVLNAMQEYADQALNEERERHAGIVDVIKEHISELQADGWTLAANELREALLDAGYEI